MERMLTSWALMEKKKSVHTPGKKSNVQHRKKDMLDEGSLQLFKRKETISKSRNLSGAIWGGEKYF